MGKAERRKRNPVSARTAAEVHDVWTAIDDLRNDAATTRTDIATIGSKIDSLGSAVNTLAKDVNSSKGTPWGVLIGAGGLMLSLITAIGGAALTPLYQSDSYNSALLKDHMESDGHPTALRAYAGLEKDVHRIDARHIELKRDIENLDTVLQREMRALDQISATRLDNLDTVLQREMRFLDDIQTARREAIEARVANAEKHLSGRDGMRFNMPDYERLIEPTLTDLRERMLFVEGNRYSGDEAKIDWDNHDENEMTQAERIAKLEAMLEKVVREQEQRTAKVYEE